MVTDIPTCAEALEQAVAIASKKAASRSQLKTPHDWGERRTKKPFMCLTS
jgi:hypothetical protein